MLSSLPSPALLWPALLWPAQLCLTSCMHTLDDTKSTVLEVPRFDDHPCVEGYMPCLPCCAGQLQLPMIDSKILHSRVVYTQAAKNTCYFFRMLYGVARDGSASFLKPFAYLSAHTSAPVASGTMPTLLLSAVAGHLLTWGPGTLRFCST